MMGYKLNVDGAMFVQDGSFGMGAIIRDHGGNVLAAMSCKGHGLLSAENMEACRSRRALQWAQEMGFRRIRWNHVRREGNGVAHELARRAATINEDEYWFQEAPEFVLGLINDE
ncbi:hypothetical protein SLE2022_258570 [Rubroshorea leprosula]